MPFCKLNYDFTTFIFKVELRNIFQVDHILETGGKFQCFLKLPFWGEKQSIKIYTAFTISKQHI